MKTEQLGITMLMVLTL